MSSLKRLAQLKTMLELEPNDLFLNYSLGLENLAQSNINEAEFQFKKALDLNPDYIPAYYQLGKLFEFKKNTKQAILFFKNGLEKARLVRDFKAINEFGEAIFLLED